ncbi:hypothetical protein BDF20DRAFT_867463 [Mycotypha africana]|uniref:uncharacterized protein n=1 Tax=Mycotypha africana TaxID=64632 RepID=UPI002300196E|nr:uncharacterized protein BDF20DRAFT_867463 [Mycotypha africana]KAI8979067.1 hypothetical protein BDF20DRAFT_867463 [Mycotypha africana]
MTFVERIFYVSSPTPTANERTVSSRNVTVTSYNSIEKEEEMVCDHLGNSSSDRQHLQGSLLPLGRAIFLSSFLLLLETISFTFLVTMDKSTFTLVKAIMGSICLFFASQFLTTAIIFRKTASTDLHRINNKVLLFGLIAANALMQCLLIFLTMKDIVVNERIFEWIVIPGLFLCSSAMNGSITIILALLFQTSTDFRFTS